MNRPDSERNKDYSFIQKFALALLRARSQDSHFQAGGLREKTLTPP
jgi:hypothetical protein